MTEALLPSTAGGSPSPAVSRCEHVCCLYESEAERMAATVSFLREGLSAGQRVLYIAPANTAESTIAELKATGIDTERLLASGQLTVSPPEDVYLRAGRFDPDATLSLLRQSIDSATGSGYPALRIAGEMPWATLGVAGSERLIEYEARVNEVISGSSCMCLCLYDRRQFDAEVLFDVLRAHSFVLVSGKLQSNPYYLPPTAMLANAAQARLDALLDTIVEHGRGEDELRRSEAHNRAVFEQAAVGMVVCDLSSRFVRANASFCDFVGYAEAELRGRPFAEITHPDHSAQDQAGVGRVVSGEMDRYEAEKRYIRKDGVVVWGRVNVSLIRAADGAPSHFVTVVQDITERKRAEAVLRTNQTRLEAIDELNRRQPLTVDSLCEFALEHSVKLTGSGLGHLCFYDESQQVFTNFAWSKQAMRQCQLSEMPIVYELAKAGRWGNVVRQRKPIVINELAALSSEARSYPEGHVELTRYAGIPVFSGAGIVAVLGVANREQPYDDDDVQQLTELMSSVWPIVERLKAEQALRESEERFEKAFRSNPVMLAITSLSDGQVDGKILDANPAWLERLGFTRDEVLGKSNDDLGIWSEVVAIQDGAESLKAIGPAGGRRVRVRARGGEDFEVVLSVERIELHGEPADLWAATDVTEWMLAERKVRESEERYRELFEHSPIPTWEEDFSEVKRFLDSLRAQGVTDFGAYFEAHLEDVARCADLARVVAVNAASVQLMGEEAMTGLPKTLVGYADPRWLHQFARELAALASGASRYESEINVQLPSGEDKILAITVSVPRNHADTLGRVLASFQDITERKRLEDSLRRSASFNQAVLDSLPAHVAVLDEHGLIVAVNDLWSRFAAENGVPDSANAYLGANYLSVCDAAAEAGDNVAGQVAAGLRSLSSGSEAWYYIEYQCSSETEERWFNLRAKPMEGHPGWVVVTHANITDRIQAQTALASERDLLNTIIETLPDAVYLKDREGRFLRANLRHAAGRGFASPAQLVGKTDFDVLLPHEAQETAADERRIVATGTPMVNKLEHIRRVDGADRWISATKVPVRGPGGRVIGIVGVSRDITEQHAAAQKLRASEERYRTLVDAASEGIWSLGADFRITFANEQMARMLGYTVDEMIGRPNTDFLHREELDADRRARAERAAGLSSQRETRFVRKDGSILTFLVSGTPILTPEGQFTGTVALFTDITERMRNEQIIRESEERFRLLAQTANEGIHACDSDFRTSFVNEQMARMLGYSPEEMLGRPLADFVPPAELEDHNSQMSTRRSGQGGRYERRLVCRDGRIIICQVSAAAIKDANGEFTGSVGLFTDVTERRLAEDALRESEERYRSLFTEMMTGFALHEVVCDDQGTPVDYRFLEINPAFERLTGLSRELAVGKTVRAVLPGIEDQWIESYGRVALTGEPLHYENYARELGKHFEALAYSPKRGQFAVTFTDVTERKKAERQIRASEKALNKAQRTAHVGSWAWHIQDGRLEWSDEMYRIFGITRESFTGALGDVIALAIHPEDRERVEQSNQGVITDRKPEALEYRVVWPDQSVHTVWAEADDLTLDDAGNPLMLTGIVQDITERKRAEVALAASEQQYRQIVELVPEGFWVLDADSVTTFANQSLAEMLGYSVDEMTGKHIATFRKPEDQQGMLDAIGRRRAGAVERYELDLVRKDGGIVPARASASPVFDAQGNYAGSVSLIEDLTTQRRLEGERQDLEQRLFQAQKMEAIGSLAGGVAHDFNNMLGIILGHTSLIDMELPPDSSLRDAVRIIDQTCERGSALTRQLLGFARRGKREEKPFNPATLVEEVAGLVRRTFDRSIVVETRVESRGWQVLGDSNQIHQALMNLAINSRDAMPNGGRLTLSVANTTLSQAYAATRPRVRPGRYVVLTVADTGIGMSPEVRDRAFEPFFTTKDVGKGTGLGLASAYGIVDNHGGYIDLDSEPGVGTSFRIYLPATDDVEGSEPRLAASAAMPTGTATILLVDDEPAIREIGKLVLGRLGYQVMTANDGAQALGIFRWRYEEIGLVILDMSMPVLGGRETAQQLMSVNPGCRILLASGYSADGDVGELLRLENVSFVQKPFRARQLADAVKEALGGR